MRPSFSRGGNMPFFVIVTKVFSIPITLHFQAALCAEDNCKVEAAFVLPTPTEIVCWWSSFQIIFTVIAFFCLEFQIIVRD
mgnify:CR=1 FL=1